MEMTGGWRPFCLTTAGATTEYRAHRNRTVYRTGTTTCSNSKSPSSCQNMHSCINTDNLLLLRMLLYYDYYHYPMPVVSFCTRITAGQWRELRAHLLTCTSTRTYRHFTSYDLLADYSTQDMLVPQLPLIPVVD